MGNLFQSGKTFQRVIRVTAGPRGRADAGRVFGNTVTGGAGHHVAFDTTASEGGQAAECNLRIYNLTDTSAALFQDPTALVRIEAGYRDYRSQDHNPYLGIVFQGNPDPSKIRFSKSHGDWQLDVSVRDGGYGLDYGRLDKSYSTATSLIQLMEDARKSMGLGRGYIDLPSINILGRCVVTGPSRETLDMIVASAGGGRRWFIRDGALHIMARTQTTPEGALVISSDKGNLIEPPTALEEGGFEFVAMLDPFVRIGRVVKVESIKTTAFLRVTAVSFQADNFGGNYQMKIRAVRRDGSPVTEKKDPADFLEGADDVADVLDFG